MKSISVEELHSLVLDSESTILIDVRSPGEHRDSHIPGAKNISLDELEVQADWLRGFETVYTHCKMGGRSSRGCKTLAGLGLSNVVNVKGGVAAWEKAGFEVESEK
jgi:rhodanese-related sulfurtransferase